MGDLFFFDTLFTTRVITFVYWILLSAVLVGGLGTMFGGLNGLTFGSLFSGLLIIGFGTLGARLLCELIIVLFKMNEALQDLRGR